MTDLAPISCYVLLLYHLLYSAYFRFTAKSNIFHPFHPLFTGKLYTRVEQRAENWNFIGMILYFTQVSRFTHNILRYLIMIARIGHTGYNFSKLNGCLAEISIRIDEVISNPLKLSFV